MQFLLFHKMAGMEFEFFVNRDMGRYKGQYITLVGDKIAASRGNAKVVWNEAKKKTGKAPTIAKIPQDDALVLYNLFKYN